VRDETGGNASSYLCGYVSVEYGWWRRGGDMESNSRVFKVEGVHYLSFSSTHF
jgi:hypothetical protein